MGKRKRIWSTGILMLCMALAGGCGKNQKMEKVQESEKTVITVMASGYTSQNGLSSSFKDYVKKNLPGVELEVSILPDEQYYAALKLMLANGEGPDIMAVQAKYAGENSVFYLANAGYLEPLTDMDCETIRSEQVKESFEYNGEIYAMGRNGFFTLGTLYNKDIFKKFHLEVPKNWEEFLKCCETLKKGGITPITMGDKDVYVTQFGLYQLAANVVYTKDKEFDEKLWTGEKKFTDKGYWDEVIAMYKTLYDEEYMDPDSLKMGLLSAHEKFAKGDAAMIFSPYMFLSQSETEQPINYGYFPLPGNKKGEETQVVVSTQKGGWGIYTGSKHKELCKKILAGVYGERKESKKNEELSYFYEAVDKGNSIEVCNSGWPSGTENELEQLFIKCVGSGELSVEDVTNGTQKRMETLRGQFKTEICIP